MYLGKNEDDFSHILPSLLRCSTWTDSRRIFFMIDCHSLESPHIVFSCHTNSAYSHHCCSTRCWGKEEKMIFFSDSPITNLARYSCKMDTMRILFIRFIFSCHITSQMLLCCIYFHSLASSACSKFLVVQS